MKGRRGLAVAMVGFAAGSALALAGAAPAQTESYPRNTEQPSIQGSDPRQEGQVLRASQGEWEGPPPEAGPAGVTVKQEWLRCDSTGADCVVSGGGTSHALDTADVGKRIRYRETASCDAPQVCETKTATTSPTGVVLPDPSNVTRPRISGAVGQGQLLSGTTGFWRSVAPLSYSFQWQRCDGTGNACTPVPGASSRDYRIGGGDAGHRLRLAVTARNARPRAATATTTATEVVPALPLPSPTLPARPRLLSPFPKVTVAGTLVGSRVVVSEFSITAPRRSLVGIRCRGRGCPLRSRRFRMRRRRARVRALQRALRPGIVIEVRITKRGFIGKYTRIRVRRGRVPSRRDLCLRPGATRPTRCPRR